MRMESSGADSRGGVDRFPEGGLVILRRRFWKEGTVRNKSPKSKRCLQVWHQEKSMFNHPKACNVRKRYQEVEEEGGCSPRTPHFFSHSFLLLAPKTLCIGV